MPAVIPANRAPETARSRELLLAHRDAIHRRTDRLFGNLMLIQWLAGIGAALWISPRTWAGAESQIHLHVWAAILLGGAIVSLPLLLVRTLPGWAVTRQIIAIGQILTSALLIHLTGGRIETHFHVFGSLAFLAIYRDWRVLVTATVVAALDHFVRGVLWPQSVFGVLAASPWRWVEHAGWIAFEDVFLVISIRQSLAEMHDIAVRRATLEELHAGVERQVADRTAELAAALRGLQAGEQRFRMLSDSAPIGIFEADPAGGVLYTNPEWQKISGQPGPESIARGWQSALHPDDEARISAAWEQAARAGRHFEAECRCRRPDGEVRWVHTRSAALRTEWGEITRHVATVEDITERKRAQSELETLHRELIETSRRAGMAEVATAVLHNVGNVLNSVNVAASCVAHGLRKSTAAAGLGRVVALLRAHEADLGSFFTRDPRASKVSPFLAELAAHQARQQAAALDDLAALQKNIDHIKEIVAMQQTYAKVAGVSEQVNVADLLEDTLRMNAESFARHDLRVVRDFAAVPPVTVEKHKVLQILVNLLRNAKHACEELGQPDKTLTLRVSDGGGTVKIAVTDNGIGIPPENLTRIFSHGFTTKKQGHGFGLHSGALAARELGGALRVESAGPGRGATFTLELPAAAGAAESRN